ncbi:hypothetical protein M0805_008392 [Coniferiporia weirii]|nr:hypothetical protein M0805_008392 [Coniferiporia weirii]
MRCFASLTATSSESACPPGAVVKTSRFASTSALPKWQSAVREQDQYAGNKPPTPPTSSEREADVPLARADEKRVHIGWDPLVWSRYHNFWLRDHCRCEQCFHHITKQRLVNTFDIPPDIQPSSVEAAAEGLKVTWHSPGSPHVSIYPWNWLKWNSHESIPENVSQGNLSDHHKPRDKVLWGAKIVQDPPMVAHDYVMNDEHGLWKLLKKIDTFGFCFVQGVEATPEATEGLTLRIANIRQTQYGSFWDFTSDLAKGDTAYTTLALGAHTDTTYFTDPCGLQLFHLLSHTDGIGGQTLLVDGFYAASLLRELHPEAYHTLATVRVPTHAAGEPGELYRPSPPAGYPILNLDPQSGGLMQVRYNNDDRSVMRGLSSEELEKWYGALRLWNKTLKSPDSEYWVQLAAGTAVALVIDNHRVLHGRSAFNGKRRMCGAYIGMDDYRSKLAVLTEKMTGSSESTPGTASGTTRSNWGTQF